MQQRNLLHTQRPIVQSMMKYIQNVFNFCFFVFGFLNEEIVENRVQRLNVEYLFHVGFNLSSIRLTFEWKMDH